MTSDDLINQLKRHEGFRSKPYRCTAGKLTIGIGRNLDDKGISEDEAMYMLLVDIQDATNDLIRAKPDVWEKLKSDSVRQCVLINMCFNLGISRLLQFKKMWAAIEAGSYAEAADEMLDSRWATQVGERALELSDMMRTGIY